jgi:NADH-quinone oxidoreductase subunit J
VTLPAILFWLVAAGTAASAVGVLASRGVIRAAVFLLFTLVGVALLYFLLGAEFLGAAQMMIYVGGTLVLVVFGGMLTAGGPYAWFPVVRREWLIGGALSVGLFGLLASVSIEMGRTFPREPDPKQPKKQTDELPGVGPLGLGFLGVSEQPGKPSYLLPFEIVSIHLLVVLIGAAYLARSKKKPGSTGATREATTRVAEEYERTKRGVSP